MIRKILFGLFCIYGSVIIGRAQVTTNKEILNESARSFKIATAENLTKAKSMARTKGWPLSIKTRKGTAVLAGVDAFGFPQYIVTHNNIIAAATTRANQLWPGGNSGLGLSGSSANMKNKIGIWDVGAVLGTHVELAGRVTQKDNSTSAADHPTHVSGTMIASGVNPLAKGMAYGAPGLIAYDVSLESELPTQFSEANNLLLSNHSYGYNAGWVYNSDNSRWEFWGDPGATEDYKFGYYSDYTQTLDSIAYNAPYYLMVYSAGNPRDDNGPDIGEPYYRRNSSGTMVAAGNRPAGISNNDSYDIITYSNGAKNCLTVGAVNGIPGGYGRKEDVVMSSFSAWGPTDDGRIKPDIVADGVNVLSSIATTNSSYASFSGTSMASPNTTGSLFLLQEYYSKLKSGAFLRSATLKGLAIHTADEAGPTPGPDYQFGWGLLNVEKAAAVITAAVPSNNAATSAHQLYENTLNNGQTSSTTVVASGKGILSATISWTDVKGNVDHANLLNNRAKNLVNDLDIRITKGSGPTLKTYLPWTLDVENPSFAAVPGDNITDNVERIDIDSTIPGQTYTVTVSHKGTLARGSQAYSLLISGVGGAAYCTSASGGGGARIDSVSFKTIHAGNPAGSKTYTDYTTNIADIEPSQTVPIAIKVSTYSPTPDVTTNNRIVKVFIDLNNNGAFEASELMTTSAVLNSTTQVFNGSIVVPGNLTIGSICLMRIVVQETSNAGDVQACGVYGQGETQDYRIRIVAPSNDVLINQVLSPMAGDCANTSQYLTVSIKNNGSVSQSNIPITASVTSGGTTIANLSATYTGRILPLSTVIYTFQTPFTVAAGATYSISASTNLAADQLSANDQLVSSIAIAAKPVGPIGTGEICGTGAILKLTNADASNYFWYTSAAGTSPFAAGSTATTTTIPADKTFYVAKEAKVSVGPVNKLAFPAGGYNTFVNNFIKFNNAVPVVIENARLYIGNPGKVTFTLANLINEDLSTGSYTYQPLADPIVLDVAASNPNPTPGAVNGNPTNDMGAVYYLNLPVTTTGDHIIIIQCTSGNGRSDSASIYRNNGITSTTTYPIGIPNIMTFTGNSANTGGSLESQFYYFFYDVHINTGACVSDRTAITAATAATPVISQQADSLVSSIGTGNQWYLNDTAIIGATGNHYKPTKAGKYKVTVVDAFGCSQTSNMIIYAVTAIVEAQAEEIKLKVSPNPNNGIFNLSFEVSTKADLTIDILNSSGRKVYSSTAAGFIGKYAKQISLESVSAEMYVIKIQHDKKLYVKKLLIQR